MESFDLLGNNTPADIRYATGMRLRRNADAYCAFHRHQELELVYHPGGSGKTRWGDVPAEICFEAGSLVLYAPGCRHDQRMERGGDVHCILITIAQINPALAGKAMIIPHVHNSYVITELNALSLPTIGNGEFLRREWDARARALLAAITVELKNVMGTPAKTFDHVAIINHCIAERLADIKTVSDIAKVVGMSPDYLRHVFVKQTGMTITEALAEARLRRVSDMLRYSSLPLKAIAEACGFQNERYLCCVFKKHSGITPNAYRGKKR